MKARVAGVLAGGSAGAMIGAGTGIVGGPFGAVAGMTVFAIGGAVWGFSAGPDAERQFYRWREKRKPTREAED
jgi:uncharacterized protein YcfJ